MGNRMSDEKKMNKLPIIILIIIIAILLGMLLALALNSKKAEMNVDIKDKDAVGSETAYSDIFYFTSDNINSKTELLNFWVSNKTDSKGRKKIALLIAQEADEINYPKTIEINGKKVSEIHEYSTFDLTSGIKIGDSKTSETISYDGINSDGKPVVYEVIYCDYIENLNDGIKINIKTDSEDYDYDNEKAQVNFVLLVEHNLGQFEGDEFKADETIIDWKQSIGCVGSETIVTDVHTKNYSGYNYANKATDKDGNLNETIHSEDSIDVKIGASEEKNSDDNKHIAFYYTANGEQKENITAIETTNEQDTSESSDSSSSSKKSSSSNSGQTVTTSKKTTTTVTGRQEQVLQYKDALYEKEKYNIKRTDLSYIVRYIDSETGEEISESKEIINQTYQDEVTEEAKTIKGYVAQEPTSKTISIGPGENEIIFNYVKKSDLSYKVYYLEKDTNNEIADSKEVKDKKYKESVTEEAIEIDGYVAQDPTSVSIEIDEETNEIKFYYVKRNDLTYKVLYIDQDTDEEIDSKEENNKTYKESITENAKDIDGYVAQDPTSQTIEITTGTNEIKFYYVKRNDLSYTVYYKEQGSNETISAQKDVDNKTFKESVTEEAIEIDGYVAQDPTSQTIEITTGTNEITFYYVKRNDLNYTVYYEEQGTNETIASPKEENNKTFKESITENAIDVDGYVAQDPTSQTIEITTGINEITFYYTKRNDLTYKVYYKDQDSGETIDEKEVTGQTYKSIITENAKSIEGYVEQNPTSKTIEIGTGTNEIIFYYAKRNDLTYKVYYKDQDSGETIDEKQVTGQTYKSIVTETAKDINGYVAQDPTSQTFEIKVSNDDVYFYYKKRNDLTYIVRYIEEATSNVLETKTVTNQTFKDEVTEEAIEIEGYIAQDPTSQTIEITAEENEIEFYYTKRNDFSYTVYYCLNEMGEDDWYINIMEPKYVEGQTYLDEVTENAIDIPGYVAQDPTSQTIEISTGFNEIYFFYTRRNDLSYTVYYLEDYGEGTREVAEPKTVYNQTYGYWVTEEAIDINGYYANDPTIAQIEIGIETNEIVFYYTPRTDMTYKVNYLEIGTEKVLAEQKVVYNKAYESSVTENSIDIEGYKALEPTSVTMVIDEDNKEINLYYEKRGDLSYIVYYLESGTESPVADPKVEDDVTFEQEITEYAIPVDGYNALEPTSQTIIIDVEGNIITFYYEKRTDLTYTVHYLEEDSEYPLADSITIYDQTYKDSVTEDAIDIPGYVAKDPTTQTIEIGTGTNEIKFYYTKQNDLSYIVKYLEQGTNNEVATQKVEGNRTYQERVTENAIDVEGFLKLEPTTQELEIEAEGDNVITFYYAKMNQLTYSVHYIDQDTNEEIADTKNIGERVYQEEITENAIDIPGYVAQDPTSQTIEIGTGENRIDFYYKKRGDLSYVINYIEQDTGNTVKRQSLVENQTYLDTIYTSNIEKSVDNYVYVGCDKDSFQITMDTNEVTLYYLQKVTLTTKYIDKNSGQEIRTAATHTNYKVGDYYDISGDGVSISNYTLIESPSNTTGYCGHNNLEFIYYYAKNTRVYVRYYDAYSNTSISSQTYMPGYVGKPYTTSPKTLTNYECIRNEGQVSGLMTEDTLYVTYYYAKKTKVNLSYYDKETNESIATSSSENGYVGKHYEVNPLSITGYVFVNAEGDTSGEMTETPKEVKFYYAKNTSIVVKYVDKYTQEEVSNSEPIPGNSGEDYDATTYKKDLNNYVYLEDSGNVTGTYKNDPVEVIYYYAKKVNLISKYVDKYTGEEIKDSSSREVIEGENYSAQETSVDNYTFVEALTDTTGTVGDEDITVSFGYKKNLTITVKYYDQYSNEEINSKVVNTFEYEDYNIEIEEIFKKDDIEYAITEVPNNYFGTMDRENIEVKFYYKKTVCLNVQYVDYSSKDLLKEKTENKYPGDEGKTDDYIINIKGYTFIEKPSEEEYVMDNEYKTLTYAYAKNSRIIVKIIDQDTNEEVTKQIIEGYEGMEYDIDIPVEGEYVYIAPTKDFTHIKMTDEDTVVVFTLARKSVATYSILPATGDGVIKWLTLFGASITLIIIIRKTLKGTKIKPYIK